MADEHRHHSSAAAFNKQFFDIISRSQEMQADNPEKPALIWEATNGDLICGHTPPPLIENGFQFNDSQRWRSSATNPRPFNNPLRQGDPMTLTWSFIPDGSNVGAGFNCGVPGESSGTNLIGFLDGLYGQGPGGSDLTRRPWFSIFNDAFANWGRLNGIRYVYEPNDDGAAAGGGGFQGQLGVRGDLRIGGHRLDGRSNVLACNYFASNGDMIIDTGDDRFYAPQPNGSTTLFRNVLEHEHGHGLSISHVCPIDRSKLMEPFVAGDFLGAQEDDILAANRGYGDRDEFPNQNDTRGSATSLGFICFDNSRSRTQISIDGNTDQDYYSFDVPDNSRVSVTVTPTGSTYLQGPQNSNGSCSAGTSFNSLIENNLGVELRNPSGNLIATANSRPAGQPEQISDRALTDGAGRYFVRIFGNNDRAQLYNLNISAVAADPEDSTDPCNDECSNFVVPTANGDVVNFCL